MWEGLAPDGGGSAPGVFTDTPSSGASPLPHLSQVCQVGRRCGLVGELYRSLEALARADGVEVVYLHTHPFLPGAIDFWIRQGFEVVDVEADPVWQTTHMHRSL